MKDYQGKMQFNVSDFRLATEEEMKESGVSKDDFYEYAKLDIDTLQEKIVSYIDKINNEILKSVVVGLIKEHYRDFSYIQQTLTMHHNYFSGLNFIILIQC